MWLDLAKIRRSAVFDEFFLSEYFHGEFVVYSL